MWIHGRCAGGKTKIGIAVKQEEMLCDDVVTVGGLNILVIG